MKKFVFVVIFTICLFPIYCDAQDTDFNEKAVLSYMGYNPFSRSEDTVIVSDIDNSLVKCVGSSGSTTMGEIACYTESIQQVEQEILKVYKELYAKLDETDKSLFKTSQDSWNTWYKQERTFLQSTFYITANYSKYGHGREHSIAELQWLFQIIRQRLIALRVYSDNIN